MFIIKMKNFSFLQHGSFYKCIDATSINKHANSSDLTTAIQRLNFVRRVSNCTSNGMLKNITADFKSFNNILPTKHCYLWCSWPCSMHCVANLFLFNLFAVPFGILGEKKFIEIYGIYYAVFTSEVLRLLFY